MNERQIEARRQQGLVLAATAKITRAGEVFRVPSQSSTGLRYEVRPFLPAPSCTCPDHQETREKCKHILAVEHVLAREADEYLGAERVTESVIVTKRMQKTYPQNWAAYNAAQVNEKREFQTLLFDLCRHLDELPRDRREGRPRVPLRDAMFAIIFKVYSTLSQRRFMSDLSDAHTRGYISTIPHFNSISNYLAMPALTPILSDLIERSAVPLKEIEEAFAVDSTGFSAGRYVNWNETKHGGTKTKASQKHDWVKTHLICGVRTNIVTSVMIGDRHAGDAPFLPPLVESTARRFRITEVSADKAYGSVTNFQAIEDAGGVGYIAFKANATGGRGGAYERAYHLFCLNREEFFQHYHKRSNVESTMHMIKSKFRSEVRSKTDVAMKNEVLCKVLGHNIVCLVHAIYELELTPEFFPQADAAGSCTIIPASAQQSAETLH